MNADVDTIFSLNTLMAEMEGVFGFGCQDNGWFVDFY